MKPARARQALGAANPIVKFGWSTPEDMKDAEQADRQIQHR